MLNFIRSMFRPKHAPPPPEPIERGSVWELRGDDDPFPPKRAAQAVVLDYASGWVRYSMGDVFRDQRMKEDSFRYCYRKISYATTAVLSGGCK